VGLTPDDAARARFAELRARYAAAFRAMITDPTVPDIRPPAVYASAGFTPDDVAFFTAYDSRPDDA
jgi:hypothetical protein